MATDILIVGGGPAGLAAASFLARAKRKVTLIQRGGAPLHSLHWIMPGAAGESHPEEWIKQLRSETEAQGIEILDDEVVQATLGASEKKLETAGGKTWEPSVILLASGCYERRGFIEGEEKFVGRGVYYNAYQDGFWFEGKTLIAEGKSENSIREVLHLSRFAAKIYYVVPAMKLEGNEALVSRLKKCDNVEMLLSASTKKISGRGTMESVTILSGGEEKEFNVEGLFLYGRQSIPQYDFLKGTVEISEDGAVMVDDSLMTSIPGVFACGDMIAGVPQMPFVSAAQGMVAAMHADCYLSNLNG